MDNELRIYCTNIGEYVDVEGGETLQHVYERIKDRIKIRPISVMVNNRDKHLAYPLYGPKHVEFIDRNTIPGRRTYTRSLVMILHKATKDLFPEERLVVPHAIGKGYFCTFKHNHSRVDGATVKALKQRVKEIIAADMPFIRHERPTVEVLDMFRKQGMNDKVRFLSYSKQLYTVFYELDNIIDSFQGPLAPSTGQIDTFDLVPYKDGMLLLLPDPDNPSVPAKAGKHEKIYNAFMERKVINHIIKVSDVSELNKAIKAKRVAEIINIAETIHSQELGAIASQIADRFKRGGARIVLIAGPSSSGKTTSAKRLSTTL